MLRRQSHALEIHDDDGKAAIHAVPRADGWIERWLGTTATALRTRPAHPMVDAVIDEIDGRMIRIGDRWLADFASCNYLGLDLEPSVIQAVTFPPGRRSASATATGGASHVMYCGEPTLLNTRRTSVISMAPRTSISVRARPPETKMR